MKNRKHNCRGFLSAKAIAYGENRVASPVRKRNFKCVHRFNQSCRKFRHLSSIDGTSQLPQHWSPLMDAVALARVREELEAMRVFDEVGFSWGI